MKLPRIYEHFVPGQLVTISEMREKLERTGNTLRKRVCELAARGYLHPIRQGLYLVCNAAQRDSIPKLSPFVIASRVSAWSHIGYRSALQFHAGIEPPLHSTITVVSPSKFNAFDFKEHHFIWCQSYEDKGVLVLQHPWFGPNTIRVTSLEKSIVDCLKRPLHCNNLTELLHLSATFRTSPSYSQLIELVQHSAIHSLYNRLGFYLEIMSDLWDTPTEVIEEIRSRSSPKTTEWPVLFQRIPQTKAHNNQSFIPGFQEIANIRSRWKVQFPRSNSVGTRASASDTQGRLLAPGEGAGIGDT